MTTPNPYGSDLLVTTTSGGVIDIDPGGILVEGIGVFAQSLFMRQTTPLGSLLNAPNDCIDVRSWVSRGMTIAQLQQLQSIVKGQILRDQRAIAAQVGATFNFGTANLTLTEQIQSTLGPFTLTLSVSQVTAAYLVSP